MRPGLALAVVMLGGTVPAVAQEPPVRPSKCPAMGRGIVWVGHWKSEGGGIGDPNGSGGPWIVPPPGATNSPTQPEAVYLGPERAVHTDWGIRATGDFDGDGTCDLVWTNGGESVALTITDATSTPPVFNEPDYASVFAVVSPLWTLVGSGDFVGAGQGSRDGRPDLVFWHAGARRLGIWASDGAGGFPTDQRHVVPVYGSASEPVVVADIDGQGAPEVIWFDASRQQLAYSRIVPGASGLESQTGGPLTPRNPEPGWTIRAADDFDGDGQDDLILQNETSEQAVVWFMEGPTRRASVYFSPARLAPPNAPEPDPQREAWLILGPR